MAEITLEHVTKEFAGGVVAVDDVNLTIEDGEFMVLVGPSGCGKSTLLRMIAGLEEITDGTISIGDRDVTELPPPERDIAMVFQNYALYPHMSVRAESRLRAQRAPHAEGRDQRDASTRSRRCSASSDLLDRKPAHLSGGQRQRVAMGRAIIREPVAFLMDEPLSNLDAKLRVGMRASLAQLHARLSVTSIYVTHDQTEAMTLGHRVAVMRDGRVVQVDVAAAPLPVSERPLRRGVHRVAVDEPRRGDGRGRHDRVRSVPRPARARAAASRAASAASCSESGPRRSTTPPSARHSCRASR